MMARSLRLRIRKGSSAAVLGRCIKDLGNETAKIAEAVDLFRSHDKGEVLKGLEALGKGLDGLPATCAANTSARQPAHKLRRPLKK